MPISCPKCNRAATEGRAKCIYCGAELPPSEAKASATSIARLVRRMGPSVFHLVLLPRSSESEAQPFKVLSDEMLSALRKKFRADLYQWNQWQKCRAPLILRACKEKVEAEAGAEFLRKYDLLTTVVPSDDLNALGYSFRAKMGSVASGQLIFSAPDRSQLQLPADGNFIMIRGKITVQKNPARDLKKRGDVQEGMLDEDSHDYEVFDLFSGDPALPALRIKNTAFDFRLLTELGIGVTSSSLVNFNHLVNFFRQRYSALFMDETFRHLPPVMTDEKTAGLFDPTTEHVGQMLYYQNNERQFDLFSRLMVFLHERRIIS